MAYVLSIVAHAALIISGDFSLNKRLLTMKCYPFMYRFQRQRFQEWQYSFFIECIVLTFVESLVTHMLLVGGVFKKES